MGLFKALRAAKGALAAGSPDGQRPASLRAGLEAFGSMMIGIQAPMLMLMAPERGRPLPGTEPGALAAGTASSLANGVAGIAARDSAFDQGVLTTFADQVFAAVVAVWSSHDPSPVRGVLADGLWDPLAASTVYSQSMHRADPSGMGIVQLAALQEGRATLAGAYAGAWYDSARFAFEVRLGEGAPEMARAPWAEEWLFQRSTELGGDPMTRPEHCPTCGSPTDVDRAGACTSCRVVMPVLTAGWLVSRVQCHNPFLQAQYDQMVAMLRQNPGEVHVLPPELRALLPADLQAMAGGPGPGSPPGGPGAGPGGPGTLPGGPGAGPGWPGTPPGPASV